MKASFKNICNVYQVKVKNLQCNAVYFQCFHFYKEKYICIFTYMFENF